MDENNMSPELTLDAVPTLTLDPAADEAAAAAAAEEEKKVEPVMIEAVSYTHLGAVVWLDLRLTETLSPRLVFAIADAAALAYPEFAAAS